MKKIILIACVLFFATISVFAQPWAKFTQRPNPNFFDIQQSFYKYQQTLPKEIDSLDDDKDSPEDIFKRWEWYWAPRVGKTGEFPKPGIYWTEWENYKNTHHLSAAKTTSSTPPWSFIGPTTSTGALAGYIGIGRVACIGFHPTNGNIFWVGTADGGLWQTTDGGTSWTTNTDQLPVLGVSSIAINPNNPDTMYIATGDADGANTINGGDSKSVGVLKSTDGGTTWDTTGLNWNVASQFFIRTLIIDPTNPSVLLASGTNGIWRTTDAGATWNNQQAGSFIDIVFGPSNHNDIYASTYNYYGNAQIYTSHDNGLTWTISLSIPDGYRIKLAVSPAAPNYVEAMVADTAKYGLLGLWNSHDNGNTWNNYYSASCSFNIMNGSNTGSGCGGQGYYDMALVMNPTNASELFLGGVNTWQSYDTGNNWNLATLWYFTGGTPLVHGDKHFLAYSPVLPNTLFECNDGGVYLTSDDGLTWTNITPGIGNSEMYKISASQTVSGDVICGLQDNGTKEYFSGNWNNQTGGDGMKCLIDYTNANIQYAAYVDGQIYRTTNDWGAYTTIVNNSGSGVDTAGAWVTPYLIHPTNHTTLLVGKNQVFQSINSGTTWSQLGTISTPYYENIVAMAYAPSNPNIIFVAYPYYLYRTINGGATWELIDSSNQAYTDITVSNTNPNKVWYTTSGFSAGNKVFYSNDGGTTWSNISGTLPNVAANCILYCHTGLGGLYLGTDLGVYYRDTAGTDWISYNNGFPHVVVDDLDISYFDNTLYAGTYGRGLWKSNLEGSLLPIIGNTNICLGNSIFLSDSTSGGTWSSSNPTIASINTTTGFVHGISLGTATITYALSSTNFVTNNITVVSIPDAIMGIDSVCVGNTTILSDVSTGGTWHSNNTAIAAIAASGIATGIVPGMDTITYSTAVGCSVSAILTVTPHPCNEAVPFNSLNRGIIVFPNPATQEVAITLPNNHHTILTVTNNLGQVFLKQDLTALQSTLNINNLPNGLYYLSFASVDGVWMKKLVKM